MNKKVSEFKKEATKVISSLEDKAEAILLSSTLNGLEFNELHACYQQLQTLSFFVSSLESEERDGCFN